MYLGSVRFFKHLIISLIIILIIVPIFLSTFFAFKISALEKEISYTNADKIVAKVPKKITLDDYYDLFLKNNFSTEELVNFFEKNNISITDKIYKDHFAINSEEMVYQNKYPELYTQSPSKFVVSENVIYLTFDDGPSKNTKDILNILDKYNIKATFFVIGNESEQGKEMLREIVNRGHTVGIHSYSHDYNKIYASVDDYLDDFYKDYNYIYNTTGVKPNIFRFPGGSVNDYNRLIYKQIIAEMTRRGFVYYDWNVSGEDACSTATWTSIYNNVISLATNNSRSIVLLHDGADKQKTVTVIEDLIVKLKKQGFAFDKLSNEDKPITFGYIN